MKTYTIKEILDNCRIIIFIENKEQFDRLSSIKELKLPSHYMGSYCYDPYNGNWSSSSTRTYPGAFDSGSIIITSAQIIENIPEKEENKPLKQAVYCETQEEWDFACDKYDKEKRIKTKFGKEYNTFNYTSSFRGWNTKEYYIEENYQILSFQEWCDLNGYKMNPKFEVGKWYSFNWDWRSSNSTIIAKIKEVNEDSIDISWRSYLWEENDYSTSDTYIFEDISNIKELSLEEIQQYLPDGHPNKIKTVQSFEVGKWYKKARYYLKPKKIIGTNSQCNTEYISPEGKYHANNSGIDDLRTWELLTDLTEIQQYLPDEHPDKFSNFNTPKYKVGDWVTVIPSDNKFPKYSKAVGYTFQIREDESHYQYFMEGHESAIDPDNKYCINYRLQDVRPATPEEIIKAHPIASDEVFELPEKWCIKSNKDIDQILCKWRGGTHSLSPEENILTYQGCWVHVKYIEDFTEITFEQFKKYVLKEPEKMENASKDNLITRAVKTNNPQLIADELDCSIEEIIKSENSTTYSCAGNNFELLGDDVSCYGLNCTDDKCPFRNSNEEAISWLRSESKPVSPSEFELERWLRETKAKNLSLEELEYEIDYKVSYSKIYKKLQGNFARNKAQILYNEWNVKQEKDRTKPTKEELLEEAKKRYPKGTKFRSAVSNNVYVSDGDAVSLPSSFYPDGIANYLGLGLFYANGKWAEIISEEDTQLQDSCFNPSNNSGTITMNYTKSESKRLLLEIDDEELPMVNIIKTNTIKQLLNLE